MISHFTMSLPSDSVDALPDRARRTVYPMLTLRSADETMIGIHFLTPISGVIEFNPNVQIQMLNAKAITSFKCRYIPYQPGCVPPARLLCPYLVSSPP